MLTENTGRALLDSGDAYGRNWERNQKMSIQDFENEPSVSFDIEGAETSKDIAYTTSVYHWLLSQDIELDDLCNEYNALPCDDWDSDIYGVSKAQAEWLKAHNLHVGDSWNTYNGESSLSQVLQGTNLHLEDNESNFEHPDYILLQVHGGCDVRGGYTDAKLIKCNDYFGREEVYGSITHANGEVVEIENAYDGYSLTNEHGESVKIEPTDKIELYLAGE